MADIQGLLDDVIETKIKNLESISTGSEEEKAATQNLATLHKLRIEEIKAKTEADEKHERRVMDGKHHSDELALKERELDDKRADRTMEEEFQISQAKDRTIDRYVRTCVEVAGLVLPLACYGIWMRKGFEFEKTGSFTSTTFKNLLNRFRPTK